MLSRLNWNSLLMSAPLTTITTHFIHYYKQFHLCWFLKSISRPSGLCNRWHWHSMPWNHLSQNQNYDCGQYSTRLSKNLVILQTSAGTLWNYSSINALLSANHALPRLLHYTTMHAIVYFVVLFQFSWCFQVYKHYLYMKLLRTSHLSKKELQKCYFSQLIQP